MASKKTLLIRNTTKYGILFDLFRRSSNESDKITNKILKEIKEMPSGSRSLLDIGASDGLLAQKLFPYFKRITAVERNENDVYALNALGVKTHHCLWEDFHSEDKFDIVVASHIIYYLKDDDYATECKRMQTYLKPEGKLFVIVNAHQNDYATLMDIFYPKVHDGRDPFPKTNGLEESLKKQGVNCQNDLLTFSVDFMNSQHFLSLCGFFLGYEPQTFHDLDEELEAHYNNDLHPLKDGRKRMNVDINFLKIQNPASEEP